MEMAVIEKEALLLPDIERALLADRLLASLDSHQNDLHLKWEEEATARMAAYRQGQIEALDGPETMAALISRFRR